MMKKDSQGFEYEDVDGMRIYNFAMTKEQMLKLQKEMNNEKDT